MQHGGRGLTAAPGIPLTRPRDMPNWLQRVLLKRGLGWVLLTLMVLLLSITPRTQVYTYDCTDIRMLSSIIDLRDMEAIMQVYGVPEYRAQRIMRCIDEKQRGDRVDEEKQ